MAGDYATLMKYLNSSEYNDKDKIIFKPYLINMTANLCLVNLSLIESNTNDYFER